MKANELRIGNRLQSGKYEIIVGPAFFTAFDNYDFENGKVGVLKPEIQPIPLSKEWLLRFGFKEYKNKFYIHCGNSEMSIGVNTSHDELGDAPECVVAILPGLGAPPILLVKMYVHELQNLYFALTGLELTINPTKEENQ